VSRTCVSGTDKGVLQGRHDGDIQKNTTGNIVGLSGGNCAIRDFKCIQIVLLDVVVFFLS
ncbi:hypothetical protein MBAV_004144, partial [Candidatus Magnetobacterium bavaricum]